MSWASKPHPAPWSRPPGVTDLRTAITSWKNHGRKETHSCFHGDTQPEAQVGVRTWEGPHKACAHSTRRASSTGTPSSNPHIIRPQRKLRLKEMRSVAQGAQIRGPQCPQPERSDYNAGVFTQRPCFSTNERYSRVSEAPVVTLCRCGRRGKDTVSRPGLAPHPRSSGRSLRPAALPVGPSQPARPALQPWAPQTYSAGVNTPRKLLHYPQNPAHRGPPSKSAPSRSQQGLLFLQGVPGHSGL